MTGANIYHTCRGCTPSRLRTSGKLGFVCAKPNCPLPHLHSHVWRTGRSCKLLLQHPVLGGDMPFSLWKAAFTLLLSSVCSERGCGEVRLLLSGDQHHRVLDRHSEHGKLSSRLLCELRWPLLSCKTTWAKLGAQLRLCTEAWAYLSIYSSCKLRLNRYSCLSSAGRPRTSF